MEHSSNKDVSKFFNECDWNQKHSYEKLRLQNIYNNYLDMKQSGIVLSEPYFMDTYTKQGTENTFLIKKTGSTKLKPKINLEIKQSSFKYQQNKSFLNSKLEKRYPKRNIPTKNYVEEEEIPADRYVYCDECMNEYIDVCEKHCFVNISDTFAPVTPKNRLRARQTLPKDWLEIRESNIANAGNGVWTLNKKIPKGIRFGPYEGKFREIGSDGQYSWQIRKDGKIESYVDGNDQTVANWMRFVNCARNREEQNLMAFQYVGQIYYRSVAEIEPHTELLVFYGSKFAKELGIDIKTFNLPLVKPFEEVFKCANCYLVFSSSIYLENHFERCNRKCEAVEVAKNDKTEMQIDHKLINEVADDDTINKKCIITTDYSTNGSNKINYIDNEPSETFNCHLCSMVFFIESYYNSHMKQKHNIFENKSKCTRNSSDSGVSSSSSIDRVSISSAICLENIEPQKKQHICTVCKKIFLNPSNLEIHSRIHTGIKPFQCSICNKSFNRNGNLKRHHLIHSGLKPFQCSICNKSFSQKHNLKVHLLNHGRVQQPFQCSMCHHIIV